MSPRCHCTFLRARVRVLQQELARVEPRRPRLMPRPRRRFAQLLAAALEQPQPSAALREALVPFLPHQPSLAGEVPP